MGDVRVRHSRMPRTQASKQVADTPPRDDSQAPLEDPCRQSAVDWVGTANARGRHGPRRRARRGMGLTRARFVGRDAELRRLGESVAAAGAGERTTVLGSGDTGIGKSRLLQEAHDAFAGDKVVVAIGSSRCLPCDRCSLR